MEIRRTWAAAATVVGEGNVFYGGICRREEGKRSLQRGGTSTETDRRDGSNPAQDILSGTHIPGCVSPAEHEYTVVVRSADDAGGWCSAD